MYHAAKHRPSETTRGRLVCSPAPELPVERVIVCVQHHLLIALARAVADPDHPFLIRLSDCAANTASLSRAWERHVCVCNRSYKVVSPNTEGSHRTLQQAWTGGGLSIQHDLEEDVCVDNPVVDFMRAHPQLRQSGLWARVEAWLEAHVGRVARRPAFINGSDVRPTSTHYDEYTSIAFDLAGAKTFHIAPPHLIRQTGRGMMHESSAQPYRSGTPREQAVPQPFVRAEIPANSLLYLPRGWWHYVESRPKTIMLCAWV